MARILVTGATGFVGSHLYTLLSQDNHEVFGTTKSKPSGNIFYCNISNESAAFELVEKVQPDVIIHSAAISSVTSSSNYEYYLSNTVGTENILRAAASLRQRVRFVFLSTAGVYGNQNTELLSEYLCPKPVHHYGMSKFCCERIISNFAEAIDYTILRPFNIIGEGQNFDFIVPKLCRAFVQRQAVLRLGNIDVYRDYIDIVEATAIIRRIVFLKEAIGGTYNLCSGKAVSLKELLTLFQKFTKHDIKVEVAPEFVRKNEIWRLIGDTTKLKALIGDAIPPIPLEKSIQRILKMDKTDIS